MADTKTLPSKSVIRRESSDWCLFIAATLCIVSAISSFGVINYLQFNEIWSLKLRVKQLETSCGLIKTYEHMVTKDKRSAMDDETWVDARRDVVQNQPCCLSLAKPEYIGGTQEFINASVGQSVLLPCQASAGYPPPSVTFSPMIDPTGQNRFSVSTKGMYIQNVQLGDSRGYACQIKNIFGGIGKIFYLTVTEPVSVTTNPTSLHIKENENLTITCSISGTPPPNVTWTHLRPDGKSETVSAQMQGNSASVVTVFPARPIDAGSYTCTGTNQRETDSSTTGVTVSGKPQIIGPPKSQTSLDGSTVTLHCDTVSNPLGKVTWTYPLTGSKPPLNAYVNPDNSVTLTGVDTFNTGTYTCTASNALGSSTASANLTVEQGLGVIVTPHVYPITGSSVVMDFQCTASGTPLPTKEWLKDGMPLTGNPKYVLTSGGTLIVTGVDADNDTGVYQCEGSNKKGTQSDTVTVYKDNGQLTCMSTFNETSCNIGQLCGAKCPSQCQNQGQLIYGFQVYESHSPVCIAAQHMGTLPNTDTLVLWKHVGKSTNFTAVLSNGIQSLSYPQTQDAYSIIRPSNTTTRPTTLIA